MDALISAVKKATPITNTSTFKKFNDDLPILGNKMVQAGLCNYYDILYAGGELLVLRLNVKPIKFNEIPYERKVRVQELFDTFLTEHCITKEDCRKTYSYDHVLWEALDDQTESKFDKFNNALHRLGDAFIEEHVCTSYSVKHWSGNMDSLVLDIRPIRRGHLPMELNKKVHKEFSEFVYSFGITYEEYEDSCSGVDWIMEGDK